MSFKKEVFVGFVWMSLLSSSLSLSLSLSLSTLDHRREQQHPFSTDFIIIIQKKKKKKKKTLTAFHHHDGCCFDGCFEFFDF